MAKFNILITRDVTESTIVDVDAETYADAVAAALSEASRAAHEFDWTRDDCMGGEPYCTDDVGFIPGELLVAIDDMIANP